MAVGLDAGLEEGQKGNGGEVDGCDVGIKGFGPLGEVLIIPEFFFEFGGVGGVGLCFGSGDSGCRDLERRG